MRDNNMLLSYHLNMMTQTKSHLEMVLEDMAYCRTLHFTPRAWADLSKAHAVALLVAAIRETRKTTPNAVPTLCHAVKHIAA